MPGVGGGAKIPGGTTGPEEASNLSISASRSDRSASVNSVIEGFFENTGSVFGAGAVDPAGLNDEFKGPFDCSGFEAACAGLNGLGSDD